MHLLLKESADIEAIVKGIFHAHLLRRKVTATLLQGDDQDKVFIEEVLKSQAEMAQGSYEKGKLIINIKFNCVSPMLVKFLIKYRYTAAEAFYVLNF